MSLSFFTCVCSLPPDGVVNTLCPPIVVQDVSYWRWEKQRDHSGFRQSLGLNLVDAYRMRGDTHTNARLRDRERENRVGVRVTE